MARARNIKPSFFENEHLAELDFAARLLFIGLWTEADKEGRLEYRPKKLRKQIFPYDDIDLPLLNRYLTELARLGFLTFYVHDALLYIWINKFRQHQSPHKTERESSLPEATEKNTVHYQHLEENNGALTVKAPLDNGSCMVGIGIMNYESSKGINVANGAHARTREETHPPPPKSPRMMPAQNHPDHRRVRDYICGRLPQLAARASPEIDEWLNAGCDVEQDIIPSVDDRIAAKGGDIGSFRYFTHAILSAKAAREERIAQDKRMRENFNAS
ncbi:hypothetical protein [Tautonia plasticadhaerens]|uniref:Uncharacterized protein n=1 Tax=Tautonia plasticadhaerens TaxID=2527974 RepID=A0A518H262_9BACT|nr:hypothetical protein [Tautonia plasticadhaerens]QDV34929.1 hypothetical protein ElP_28260 [Tautonia plasticadhaerens]